MSKTKERILQAARKKFSNMGFYKTSVDEIAILSKKAKGSIYYYFSSKEELYKAVVKADLQILKTELEKTLNSDLQENIKLQQYLKCRFKHLPELKNYTHALKMATFEQTSFLSDIFEDFKIYEKKLLKCILYNLNNGSNAIQENLELVIETIHVLIKSFELQLNENKLLPEQKSLLENSAVLLLKGAHL